MGWRPKTTELDPAAWSDCDAFVVGLQLFNQGFYWEAHEVWEGCWITAGRSGPLADFLKALIKVAAALVKAREGNAAGVRRHGQRAHELLSIVQASQRQNPASHQDVQAAQDTHSADGEVSPEGITDAIAGLSLDHLKEIANEIVERSTQLASQHAADDPASPTAIVSIIHPVS